MTRKELKHSCSIVRNWLLELSGKLPMQFSEHVAILTGELTNRLKAEEEQENACDNQRLDSK